MQNGINGRRQRENSVSKCLKIDKWRQFASCELFQLPERKKNTTIPTTSPVVLERTHRYVLGYSYLKIKVDDYESQHNAKENISMQYWFPHHLSNYYSLFCPLIYFSAILKIVDRFQLYNLPSII